MPWKKHKDAIIIQDVPPPATVTRTATGDQDATRNQATTDTDHPDRTCDPAADVTGRGNARTQGQRQHRKGGDWSPRYLAALEVNGGNYTSAAKAARIARQTVYDRRDRDPQFASAEQAAIKRGAKTLEAEAVRRAVEGVTKKRFDNKGNCVSTERVYSDTLLLRLLEHRETNSWRQKQQIEHSGGMTFKTAAERKAALEEARKLSGRPAPVSAINGRS